MVGFPQPYPKTGKKYYTSFGPFWYFYLSQHMKPATRGFHYVGTWIAIIAAVLAIAGWPVESDARWLLIPAGILTTYAFGFFSHWTIEKNSPATFVYPLLSVGGDLYMFALITVGQIRNHVTEVRRRLDSGWVIVREGLIPPEEATKFGLSAPKSSQVTRPTVG